jgi:hypothetical protein
MPEGVHPMCQKKLAMLENTHIERTDFGQFLNRRHPIEHAMIPSSGIIPFLGDRCINNLGVT